jgi:hypothetical protein
MKEKIKQKPKKPNQIAAFREAAKDVDADDSEERFDAMLRVVGKRKPKEAPER